MKAFNWWSNVASFTEVIFNKKFSKRDISLQSNGFNKKNRILYIDDEDEDENASENDESDKIPLLIEQWL